MKFLLFCQVWTLSESDDLESIIDRTLKHDFDTEEARRLLKIGLLCTQDSPKIRPSMSMVAKMLKGECAVSDKIMRPGLITDVMDLKSQDSRAGSVQFIPIDVSCTEQLTGVHTCISW